jgi:hypothetical protein
VGLDDTGTAQQASLPGEARETGSFNTFRSQDGSVLGLGPFVALLPYGARETVERPASNFVTLLASQLGDACSGSESPFSRRRRTGALRGFLLGVPDGLSTASGRQRERRPVAEVARRLPRAWVSHRSEDRGRKTHSGNTMTPPMGFVSFRREETR